MLNKFWEEVEEAYQQVAVDHTRTIEVERDGKKANVRHVGNDYIGILINQVDTQSQEPLVAP